MIKATLIQPDGRKLLMLGLSFGNLDKFRHEVGDTFIKVNGQLMDLPIDVLLFSGRTEAHLMELIEDRISKDTIIHVDPKLRS